MGGLIGAGLAGLLLGHGFWGGTMGFGGFLGFLLQILLLVLLLRFLVRLFRGPSPSFAGAGSACSPAPDLPASVQQAQAATRRNRRFARPRRLPGVRTVASGYPGRLERP